MSKEIFSRALSNPRSKKSFAVISLLATMMLLPLLTFAQGDLLITPRRIVFEGNKQSQEINLANTGQDTAVYAITFVQYRMKEDGTFEQIEEPDPGQKFADSYLRYFPRTVTLPPNESQVVRMQMRRLPDMQPGEYRSHLYFRAVPVERPLGEEDILEDTTAIGIRLTPIFGITIPVIIRIGDVKGNVTLSDMTLEMQNDTIPVFNVKFNRTGEASVYGDLIVEYEPEKGGSIEVGIVRGIAVYTPNSARTFKMQLQKPEGVDYSSGKLTVRYVDGSDTSSEVFATGELILN
ncbi:MAG TPA: hypothetical protein PLI65_06085 [Bacteroidales bacterium]|nr:hypothetical protein [Bacteroidales bacterium]